MTGNPILEIFEFGQAYRITMDDQVWIGQMYCVVEDFLVLCMASRIVDVAPHGDSGAFKYVEVERAPGNGKVILNLSSVVAAVQWDQPLPAVMGSPKTGSEKS